MDRGRTDALVILAASEGTRDRAEDSMANIFAELGHINLQPSKAF